MYTWEIKNWLKANNYVVLSAKLFFEMVDASPQINHIKLGAMYDDCFEMFIGSADGLNEKVLVVKNI